ncbi:hypothetical protein M5K25_013183 [Dendrobium thyrsiflorum]|uniref:Uncharacterized protein n=1 Tax=Dendrobium thyrsiflorum TaxID=117978 RepID=A0ABD0UT03_DENTH
MEYLYVSYGNDVACLDGLELSGNRSCSYHGNSCVAIVLLGSGWHIMCNIIGKASLLVFFHGFHNQITIPLFPCCHLVQYECGGIRRAPCACPLVEDIMLIFLLNEVWWCLRRMMLVGEALMVSPETFGLQIVRNLLFVSSAAPAYSREKNIILFGIREVPCSCLFVEDTDLCHYIVIHVCNIGFHAL